MAFQTSSGLWVETGVVSESKAKAIMESVAHQRNSAPAGYVQNAFVNLGWVSLWTATNEQDEWPAPTGDTPPFSFGPIIESSSPGFDALFLVEAPWLIGGVPAGPPYPQFGTGTSDSRGFAINNPDASIGIPAGMTWSGNATSGQPYMLSNFDLYDNEGGPFYAPLFPFGTSVAMAWPQWMLPVNLSGNTGNLYLGDQCALGPGEALVSHSTYSGMNSDFAGTITLGPVTLTFSMASGWSGTGVTGNAFSGSAGFSGAWTANFNYNFTAPWRISFSMGPMSYGGIVNGSPVSKMGGGGVGLTLYNVP